MSISGEEACLLTGTVQAHHRHSRSLSHRSECCPKLALKMGNKQLPQACIKGVEEYRVNNATCNMCQFTLTEAGRDVER